MMSALTQHPEPVTEINWPLSIAALVIGLCILVPAIVRWIKSRRGK